MSEKISVVVQTSYILSDDEGHTLIPDGTAYEVVKTFRIQEYLNNGQLVQVDSTVTPPQASEPVSDQEVKSLPKSKARTSTQEQENSNG